MTDSASQVRTKIPPSVRNQIVESLTGLREEWEEAAGGKSLLSIHVSTGLILFDIVARLGLAPEDVRAILGTKLCKDLADLVENQANELVC